MYGRALVVGLLAIVAMLLVSRLRRGSTAVAAGLVVLLVVALWNTYSQSSWLALATALALLGVLVLPPVPRRWVAGACLAVALLGTPVALQQLDGDDVDGRSQVVRTGASLAAERPLLGWGVGAFEPAALARARERGNAAPGLTASHTTPITVLAELGLLGAIAYLTLLSGAAATVLARWRRTATLQPSQPDGPGATTGWPIGPLVWASAALAALVAHSLVYAGFFEDPTSWVVLAVLASLPTMQRTEGATAHTG
jgi:O-antigen ligase